MSHKDIEVHINNLQDIARESELTASRIMNTSTASINFDYIDSTTTKLSQLMMTDGRVEKVLLNINKQIDSYSSAIAVLDRERTSEVQAKFDYIERKGFPHGFAYTLYRSIDDQIEMIRMYMGGNLSDDIVKKHISDMQDDLKDRIIDRLKLGKSLVRSHLNNVFSGNALLSLHFLTVLVEELLKCYEGEPSTNKVNNSDSRGGIKNKSDELNAKIDSLTSSSYHSSELVKKSYDEVLIHRFYKKIKKQRPAELPFNNRHDIVHVYSDMDRYSLVHVYKLLLLISSILDLFEILEILNEE